MNTEEKQNGFLKDILDSAKSIKNYISNCSFEDFDSNPEKQDAVLRRFEIIGEAASKLTAETQLLFPNLPFRSMRGMRNIIAHNYGSVDTRQIWHTASKDLDLLISTPDDFFLNVSDF